VTFPRHRLLYVNVASNLLLTLNSCVNFVIYCFMGRRFRLILAQMVGCGSDRQVPAGRCAPARLRYTRTVHGTVRQRRVEAPPRWRTRTV